MAAPPPARARRDCNSSPTRNPQDVYPYRHSFYLESSSNPPSASATNNPCNKQTINAGDNPCPLVQSPLPYMLAGLAAMVLLVVISLMILACSYLKGYFAVDSDGNRSSGGAGVDAENAKAGSLQASQNGIGAAHEKIVVILAGQDKPTHLAQPMAVLSQQPPASSISSSSSTSSSISSSSSTSSSISSSASALELVNQPATIPPTTMTTLQTAAEA